MVDTEAGSLVGVLRDNIRGEASDLGGRLASSSSAPAFPGADRGVGLQAGRAFSRQVWIDTTAVCDEPLSPQASDMNSIVNSPTEHSRFLPSRPSSRTGTAGSTSSSRPASRRFTADELNCFRKVVTPSAACEAKTEAYFQTQCSMRKAASEHGLSALPVLKGKFFASGAREMGSPAHAEKARQRRMKRDMQPMAGAAQLPDEALTSAILDEIYPKTPPCVKDKGICSSPSALEERPTSSPSGELLGTWDSLPTRPGTSGSRSGNLMDSRSRLKSRGRMAHSATMEASSFSMASTQGAGPGMKSTYSIRRSLFQAAEEKMPIMLRFRNRLMEKFASVKEAHDCFSDDVPPDRGMSKKEWRRVLAKQGFEWANKEKDLLFEELDFLGTGHITLSDFHIAVEAAAPVRSLEDLRRRWIASGYNTMNSAVRTMTDGGITIAQRLTFEEFAFALSRVNVTDPSEHISVYKAICSDTASGKISLGELLAAIATVSPALLIEELRHRLNRFFAGDWDKAYFELDMDRGGTIEQHEFVTQAVKRLGMSEQEAKKAFRQIDTDSSGTISREEFVCCITLAEPSLFLEDLRLKVRRCFRSIQESFWRKFADNLTGEISQEIPKLKLTHFQEILYKLDLKEHETQMLFDLIDTSHDGELTIQEFVKGVHHFAPSVALEDLRMRCVQRDGHVSNSFAQVTDKTKHLSQAEFAQMLGSMDLLDEKEVARAVKPHGRQVGTNEGVCVKTLFDLLDVTHTGLATLGRLVAALQSCGAGSHIRLEHTERDNKSMRDMKDHLWPKRRLINDLKAQVRMGVHYVEDQAPSPRTAARKEEEEQERQDAITIASTRIRPKSPTLTSKKDARSRSRTPGGGGGSNSRTGSPAPLEATPPADTTSSNAAPPRLRTANIEDLACYMDAKKYQELRKGPDPKKPTQHRAQNAQDSWGHMWKTLHNAPSPDNDGRKRLETGLHRYFEQAALSMSHDVPLHSGVSHNSMDQYRKMRQHKAALRIP